MLSVPGGSLEGGPSLIKDEAQLGKKLGGFYKERKPRVEGCCREKLCSHSLGLERQGGELTLASFPR